MYTAKKEGEYNLYYNDGFSKAEVLSESFLKKNYRVVEILQEKSDRKVVLIEVEGIKYVLKRERGRGILDRFIGSRGRTTLYNTTLLRKKGFQDLYNVVLAADKRKGMGISESYFISEYIEGSEVTSKDYSEVMKLLLKLHSLGHYHGDTKPKNFIKTDRGVVLIDSKLKKAKVSWLGMCKDVVRFQRRTVERLDINSYFKGYRKHLSYYLAVLLIYKKEIFKGIKILEEVF